MKLKETLLKKKTKSKTDHCALLPINNLIWWVYKRTGKKNRRVLASCFLLKIRQHYPEANGQYVLHNKDKKDKNEKIIYAYIT